jgi:hypothetical protein
LAPDDPEIEAAFAVAAIPLSLTTSRRAALSRMIARHARLCLAKPAIIVYSMIRKSENRFSEKIVINQSARVLQPDLRGRRRQWK